MKGRVLDRCMVQMNQDHGQKGMVGIVKGIGGIILELHCWYGEITWLDETRYEGIRS
jgi:hypothetical protein